jgi:hypothetical protein
VTIQYTDGFSTTVPPEDDSVVKVETPSASKAYRRSYSCADGIIAFLSHFSGWLTAVTAAIVTFNKRHKQVSASFVVVCIHPQFSPTEEEHCNSFLTST